MQYRSFKGTNISEVGLGTWQLGSADWGVVNDDEAFKILESFIHLGGNFIDTADVYGMGISEQVIGRFLKTTDKEVFVASKLGRRGDGENGWPQNFTYASMRKHVEDSLQHLQLPQLFLIQLHCIPKEALEKGEVFDHLRQLQSEGLIKHWGASVETNEEALICLQQEGIASLQIIFNLFRQQVDEKVLALAKEKEVAFIIRVPLASGLLTGKFNEQTTFAPKDHRNFNANGEAFNAGETFSGIAFNQGVQFAKQIAELFPDQRTAQWSIRWILDHDWVTTVIPGASKISQVESNMEASTLPILPIETHNQLLDLFTKEIKPAIRGHY